jgi:intracellular multiplication protein IcmT
VAHWRYTGHTPKLGPFDAMALFPLALFILWWRLWTLVVALLAVAVFLVLSRRGIDALIAVRLARSWLAGRVRPAQRPGMAARRVVQGLRWELPYGQ